MRTNECASLQAHSFAYVRFSPLLIEIFSNQRCKAVKVAEIFLAVAIQPFQINFHIQMDKDIAQLCHVHQVLGKIRSSRKSKLWFSSGSE